MKILTNGIGRSIPSQIEGLGDLNAFSSPYKNTKFMSSESALKPRPIKSKVVSDLEEAIKRSGLKDGMTISFHHHFRGGDYIVNMVMEVIAKMGIKNLTLAPSSLQDCHKPLIDHIKSGVIKRIYTSGLRGPLADAISRGLMNVPVVIHSHGGRAQLIESGEIKIDVAFLGVTETDVYGNSNGRFGKSACGSLGYAMIDAKYAKNVVLLADNIVDYPNAHASITQDQVDYIVEVPAVGDPKKIGAGATRLTKNPQDLLISRLTANVIEHSGAFVDGFSMQTGSGGASLSVTKFLRDKMIAKNIKSSFALGGITGMMVELHEEGLIKKLIDVQSFDAEAATSLQRNPNHLEVSASYYANALAKGCAVNQLDIVILSALEIDTNFNVNVITGSDGVIRGASGGHCDTAAGAGLSIVVAPLVRGGRLPSIMEQVSTVITPGDTVDVLVTDHGIAVNPKRTDLKEKLKFVPDLPLYTIEELKAMAYKITGTPDPLEFGEKIVGVVKYRDGSVIDVIRQIKE